MERGYGPWKSTARGKTPVQPLFHATIVGGLYWFLVSQLVRFYRHLAVYFEADVALCEGTLLELSQEILFVTLPGWPSPLSGFKPTFPRLCSCSSFLKFSTSFYHAPSFLDWSPVLDTAFPDLIPTLISSTLPLSPSNAHPPYGRPQSCSYSRSLD